MMKAALLVLAAAAFVTQVTPRRDTPAARSNATSTIRGRVMSAATNQPLHRVRLTLNSTDPNLPSGVTDARGEYEISGIPPGTYTLSAARAGYLTMQYGQRRPRESGRTIELGEGQVIERVDMTLVRGGVIAGVITDDVGDVYPGVSVEALEYRFLRGRRALVQAASSTTNDIGQYRMSGLSPGVYVLRAASNDTWQSDDGANTHVYAHTYFPGVTGGDQAERITLAIGQDLHNVSFAMRQGRAATITGVMQTPGGEPLASYTVNLDRALRGAGGALFALGYGGLARTDAAGMFRLPGLAPGEYVVYSGNNAVNVPVIVTDGDTKHVVLTAGKLATASGMVVTDEGTPPPFPPTRLRVVPAHADPDMLLPPPIISGNASVGRDWTFRLQRLNGSYLFRISGLPREWMLAGVTLNGKPFIDTPLPVSAGTADITNLQLVLSRKGGRIDGQVVDSENNPTADATVIIFSADPSRWTIASRFVHAVRPDHQGRFAVHALAAGTYRAVARDFVLEGQWEDPEFLASLSQGATRVEVREAEPSAVTLKVQQ